MIKTVRDILKVYESFSSEEEYRQSKCLNYSKIKGAYDNPEVLATEEEPVPDKEWFTFGTLVDMMLTLPDEISSQFFVNDKVPSEQFKNIADYMIAQGYPINSLGDDDVEKIYKESGSQVNWKVDTKRAKIVENCSDYMKVITENTGKIVITTDLWNEAWKMAEVFRTHRWTKSLFLSPEEQERENVEIYYQYKIKYTFNNMKCKSKLDIIIVDHDQKVISPYDIKTGTDSPRHFINTALYKYLYGYQGVLYREGLEEFIKGIPAYKDYTVDNFRFAYMSRIKPTYPVILKMCDSCHDEFKVYGVDKYKINPLNEVMDAIAFYLRKFDEGEMVVEPYDLYHNYGEIEVESTDESLIV